MTIDYFTLNDFHYFIEQFPYPHDRKFELGEYVYYLQIDDKAKIEIRSSIGGQGMNDDTGENSIRLRLEDNLGGYLAKADGMYVTRVKGWRDRVQQKVYELVQLREKSGDCKYCGKPKKVFRSHTMKNPNRRFAKCANHDDFNWID